MAVARIWSIAHLTKHTALLITFINFAALDEFRNILSITQRTCNRVRVRVKITTRVRAKVRVRVSVSFRVRVRLWLGLGLHNWPNAQRIWSNVHISK